MPRNVLTKDQVIRIFLMSTNNPAKSKNANASFIAKSFNVSEKTVRDIWSGRTWHNETLHLDMNREPRPRARIGRPKGRKDSAPRRMKVWVADQQLLWNRKCLLYTQNSRSYHWQVNLEKVLSNNATTSTTVKTLRKSIYENSSPIEINFFGEFPTHPIQEPGLPDRTTNMSPTLARSSQQVKTALNALCSPSVNVEASSVFSLPPILLPSARNASPLQSRAAFPSAPICSQGERGQCSCDQMLLFPGSSTFSAVHAPVWMIPPTTLVTPSVAVNITPRFGEEPTGDRRLPCPFLAASASCQPPPILLSSAWARAGFSAPGLPSCPPAPRSQLL